MIENVEVLKSFHVVLYSPLLTVGFVHYALADRFRYSSSVYVYRIFSYLPISYRNRFARLHSVCIMVVQ